MTAVGDRRARRWRRPSRWRSARGAAVDLTVGNAGAPPATGRPARLSRRYPGEGAAGGEGGTPDTEASRPPVGPTLARRRFECPWLDVLRPTAVVRESSAASTRPRSSPPIAAAATSSGQGWYESSFEAGGQLRRGAGLGEEGSAVARPKRPEEMPAAKAGELDRGLRGRPAVLAEGWRSSDRRHRLPGTRRRCRGGTTAQRRDPAPSPGAGARTSTGWKSAPGADQQGSPRTMSAPWLGRCARAAHDRTDPVRTPTRQHRRGPWRAMKSGLASWR